jgi:hypothetical protein
MGGTHGLASTYRSGLYKCRCDLCTEAHKHRYRDEKRRRAEQLAADPSLAPHGKYTTYDNWDCRCEPCTKANSDRCAAWKAARKQS